MLLVGLTGGVGAGKSTAARRLAALGAVVVDADALAREVVAPGTPGLASVAAEFGPGVLRADGALDRAALGAVVFADAERRRALEAITHPLIAEATQDRIDAAVAADPSAVVVHDVPLLVELDRGDRYHLVVVVHAPAGERVRRLVTERGMGEADVRARVAAQAGDAARRAAADVWLDNTDAPSGLGAAVDALWCERLVPFEANLRTGAAAPRSDRPVSADPAWAAAGGRLVARVRRAAGERGLDVQHVGATAVPGLDAPDVIDLQVVVAGLQTQYQVSEDLRDAGLVPAETEWDAPVLRPGEVRLAVLARGADPTRAVRCTVRDVENPVSREVVALRDHLRTHPRDREAHSSLERELATSSPDVEGVATAREAFVREVLGRAGR